LRAILNDSPGLAKMSIITRTIRTTYGRACCGKSLLFYEIAALKNITHFIEIKLTSQLIIAL
jgi:hypothetical protein